MATKYVVNPNDERLADVESAEAEALHKSDFQYEQAIDSTDKFYKDQITAAKDYAETQKENQQEQTDFAIEQIEQQKAQAKQDYTKEQSGAYVDWQKQSNQYGANAEQMAANGLAKSGYSESSQVSMYNTYQNRVAAARESYTRAVLNYDNAIKDAQLQNNALLAEIAYNALQTQLELSLQGFQYKNQLIAEKATQRLQIQQLYHTKYTDVLEQINEENRLAEEVRQADMANDIQQAELKLAQDKFAYEKAQNALSRGSTGGIKGTVKGTVKGGGKTKTSASQVLKDTVALSNSSGKSAEKYLESLIASGAAKDKVKNEISIALREGAITKKQYTALMNRFAPRGVEY